MSSPAIPPVWNVRIVSCVPGSPMDCAAMIPTDSPIRTYLPDAMLAPLVSQIPTSERHVSTVLIQTFLIPAFFHCFCLIYCDHGVSRNNDFACFRMDDVICRPSAADTILQIFDDFVAIHESGNFHTRCFDVSAFAAVPFSNDNILRYVYQTTCQVTRVGCLQRCIGQTFTRTVSGNEVFQYGQTFTEVRFDRQFDGSAVQGMPSDHAYQPAV